MSSPKPSSKQTATPACPCDSGLNYLDCCQPYHQGQPAPNALALMRSRYSAYALALPEYLLATWHPDSRPSSLDLSEEPAIKWLGLAIKLASPEQNNKATVEFVARYKVADKAYRLHELSDFIKLNQRWYYLSGKQPDEH